MQLFSSQAASNLFSPQGQLPTIKPYVSILCRYLLEVSFSHSPEVVYYLLSAESSDKQCLLISEMMLVPGGRIKLHKVRFNSEGSGNVLVSVHESN